MRTSVDIQDVGPHVVHSVPPHSVHVYVNISGIVLPEAQNCVTRWAGDTFGSLDVGITVCDNASLVPMAAGMSGIAMCVPPLYGTDLTLESLRHHANHHRRLGVEWTFLYLASRRAPHASSNVIQQAARGLAMTAPNVTLLRLPWLWEFPLHQRGQTWQINDCIHRAASTRFEWTLNIDVDEFVFLYRPRVPHLAENALMTIPQLIERTSTFKTSVISLGSRIVKEFVPNGTLGMSERAHVRGGLIYCWNARRVYTPWLCSKHWGRRKHLTRTQHVWFAAVHEATHCKAGPCAVSNLDARSYWLLHVRPTGTFNPPTYKDMPTGRRTSEIHNDMLPKARNELVPQVVSHGRASVPQRAVTVVTAFIALPSNRTKHGYELNHTVKVQAPQYVAFCDDLSCEQVGRARSHMAQERSWGAHTALRPGWTHEAVLYALAEAIGVAPGRLRRAAERSVTAQHCPSAEIQLIWLAKVLFVQRAMLEMSRNESSLPRLTETTDLAWVDAGFTVYKRFARMPNPPWMRILPGVTSLAVRQHALSCHNALRNTSYSRCVVGTYIFGTRAAWGSFIPKFFRRLRHLVESQERWGAAGLHMLCADQDVITDVVDSDHELQRSPWQLLLPQDRWDWHSIDAMGSVEKGRRGKARFVVTRLQPTPGAISSHG